MAQLVPSEGRFVGPSLALLSAALFGASTPFAKILLGEIDPWMLAGLLYLGAGIGLGLYRLLRRSVPDAASDAAGAAEAPVRGTQWFWLFGAILAGGVAGPVLLLFGLAQTSASSASLLLNLEGVLTALMAWFVFRENFDRRIALGMLAIVGGAAVLAWEGSFVLSGYMGPLLICGACLAWALDNNLTRNVAMSDPVQITMLKGLVAGTINLTVALSIGAVLPGAVVIAGTAVLGLLGYGISLVLFVMALRMIGTARTGAYFSIAPFIGAVLGIGMIGDEASLQFFLAAALMGGGVWLHLSERHDHDHEHKALVHTHRHVHDIHHDHDHDHEMVVGGGVAHSHTHAHAVLRHRHAHYPDIHHLHRH